MVLSTIAADNSCGAPPSRARLRTSLPAHNISCMFVVCSYVRALTQDRALLHKNISAPEAVVALN